MNETPYTAEGRLRNGGIVTLKFGKIPWQNPKRRSNAAEVEFGWCSLRGNSEPYLSVTGMVWNHLHTDIVCGGCGVQKDIARFVRSPLLDRIVEIGDECHLLYRSCVPEGVRDEIDGIIDDLCERFKIRR